MNDFPLISLKMQNKISIEFIYVKCYPAQGYGRRNYKTRSAQDVISAISPREGKSPKRPR